MTDRFPVERALDVGHLQDWLQLRCEEQRAVALVVVERLDAQPIAREQDLPPPRVPDGEGEHAAQPIDAARAEVFVEMNDRLGVAGGLEDVAAPLQVAPQLLVVVDLAVEDDPDGAVFVRDRLEAVAEIDDAETAHADRDAVPDVDTFIVRTAVGHDAAHCTDLVLTNGLSVPPNYACDAAHGAFSSVRLKPGTTGAVVSAFRRTR